MVAVSPSPPNYGYVGYVGTDGYQQKVLGQMIGCAAASKALGSGVEVPRVGYGEPTWAADALRRAQREHQSAEDDLRIVQSLMEERDSELRLLGWNGRGGGGSSEGGSGYPHQLQPYTVKQSESIAGGFAGASELADAGEDFWWRAEAESHERFDLCVFFARLCRWPCAECVGGGRQPDIDGNPTWLGSLRRAHRRVEGKKPVDYRGVI